ncbi:MAG: hypothetical protein OFPI_24250 [Osedax symbiont Rs2]|nr:MAG: hypothetical protein OFPI_24250 [Osedax symbiont Rs2]
MEFINYPDYSYLAALDILVGVDVLAAKSLVLVIKGFVRC